MEERNYSVQMVGAIKALLDKEDFEYRFREEEGEFAFKVSLRRDQRLQIVDAEIRVFKDALTVYAISPVRAVGSDVGAVVEFITRVNYHLLAGCFDMDCDSGEVRFKCHNRFADGIPSDDELLHIISCPGYMWARYGDEFLEVVVAGADPKDAVERAERSEG